MEMQDELLRVSWRDMADCPIPPARATEPCGELQTQGRLQQ